MTAYRSLLRWILLLSMVGGLVVFIPRAQAEVTRQAPAGSVSLTVVASSRKGLGGRYVYSPWVFNIANMTLGPHGGIYFDGWSGPVIHITPTHKVLVVARPQSEGWNGNHELFGTFSSLAVLPNGTLYALYNSVLFRIGPQGQLIFVPLRSPTGQLLPNPNAPPYHYPARYPSLEYLATGPRGQVYVSNGLSVWRVGAHGRLKTLVSSHNPRFDGGLALTTGPSGSVYTLGRTGQGDDVVQRVQSDGRLTMVVRGFYDGVGLAVSRKGSVYVIASTRPHQSTQNLYRVGPHGKIQRLAINQGAPVAVGPKGMIYTVGRRTIYRIRIARSGPPPTRR